jgi:hypothetical protein
MDTTQNLKDMTNKPRIILRNITPSQKAMLMTGGLSIASFAAGSGLSYFNNASSETTQPEENCVDVQIPTTHSFCEKNLDHLSFTEAFSSARNEVGKAGFFEWKGNTYNTFTKEEWEILPETSKEDFIALVESRIDTNEIQPLNEEKTEPVVEENESVNDVAYGLGDINENGQIDTIGYDKNGDNIAEQLRISIAEDKYIILEDSDFNNKYDTLIKVDQTTEEIAIRPVKEEIDAVSLDNLMTLDEANEYEENFENSASEGDNNNMANNDLDNMPTYHNL